MVGALVVTHGNLARELVSAAKKIVGDAPRLQAVVIDWDDDVGLARAAIESSLSSVDTGEGVLIFTDMFGGTPTNISLTFLDSGQIEIVTGINLPMLIKFLNLRSTTKLEDVVEQICQKGRRSIQVASQLLDRKLPQAGKE
jgi:PTS system mannose-specific IIA component